MTRRIADAKIDWTQLDYDEDIPGINPAQLDDNVEAVGQASIGIEK